jgi:hypothetical protein
LSEPPRGVDEEKAEVLVGSCEGRRADFENEIVREIGKGILRIGIEGEIGALFEASQGALF